MAKSKEGKTSKSNKQSAEARVRRAAASRKKEKPVNWTGVLLIAAVVVGGSAAMLPKVWSGFKRLMEPTFVDLSPSDTPRLQQILFSGDPWVVFCGGRMPGGRITNRLDDGRATVYSRDVPDRLAVQAKGRFDVGLINCSVPLKSGMNLYERFRLKPKVPLVAFWVANGRNPKLIDPGRLRGTSDYEAARLATSVTKWTQLRVEPLTSTKTLTRNCVEYKRGCVLIINKGYRLMAEPQAQLDRIMKERRKMRYFLLDIRKRQVSMQLPPATMGYPQVVYIRKVALGSGVDRYFSYVYSVYDDDFAADDVVKFIDKGDQVVEFEAKELDIATVWKELNPMPRISKVAAPPPKSRPKSRKRISSTAPPAAQARKARRRAAKAQHAKESAAKREERERDQASKAEEYQRRREQMDIDMQKNAPQGVDDMEEDGYADLDADGTRSREDDDDDEAEGIDLDDEW